MGAFWTLDGGAAPVYDDNGTAAGGGGGGTFAGNSGEPAGVALGAVYADAGLEAHEEADAKADPTDVALRTNGVPLSQS